LQIWVAWKLPPEAVDETQSAVAEDEHTTHAEPDSGSVPEVHGAGVERTVHAPALHS
jgi:hypothetical protein